MAITPAAKFSVTTSETATRRRSRLAARLQAQVQGDAQLLDVVIVERAAELNAPALVDVGRRTPEDVPSTLADGVFDPDHPGAQRREITGRAGPGELAGQVADRQVAQRS